MKTFKDCLGTFERFCLTSQIELLRRCESPHIVRLLDVYDDGERFHIVTELADKGDLLALVNERGCLPEWTAAYLVKQVLQALAYLHNSQHVVHK